MSAIRKPEDQLQFDVWYFLSKVIGQVRTSFKEVKEQTAETEQTIQRYVHMVLTQTAETICAKLQDETKDSLLFRNGLHTVFFSASVTELFEWQKSFWSHPEQKTEQQAKFGFVIRQVISDWLQHAALASQELLSTNLDYVVSFPVIKVIDNLDANQLFLATHLKFICRCQRLALKKKLLADIIHLNSVLQQADYKESFELTDDISRLVGQLTAWRLSGKFKTLKALLPQLKVTKKD